MNHSIYSADRTTHLKVVIVALVAAIAASSFAISSRAMSNTEIVAIIEAGKPLAVTSAAAPLIR